MKSEWQKFVFLFTLIFSGCGSWGPSGAWTWYLEVRGKAMDARSGKGLGGVQIIIENKGMKGVSDTSQYNPGPFFIQKEVDSDSEARNIDDFHVIARKAGYKTIDTIFSAKGLHNESGGDDLSTGGWRWYLPDLSLIED
jgi:hypothetical protein